MIKVKTKGQVFTPLWIIKYILDNVQYKNDIYDKKILEPSCGTGNFLEEIIKRFIKDCQKNNISEENIIKLIKNNIIAFEIDENLRNIAIKRINNLIYKLLKINYDFSNNILLGNSLYLYKNYINYFDYIVGNPPYVKIQNLDKNTKIYIQNEFNFSKGNIDLYIIFFEISLKMLNNKGKLGFITPNSYFKNYSNKNFRIYLLKNKLIKQIVNFQYYKIFKNFSTYTAITILEKSYKNDYFKYYEFNENKIEFIRKIYYSELEEIWNFQNKTIFINKNNYKLSDYYKFLNGFATLNDKIFIKDRNDLILKKFEKDLLYPILKASKMEEKIILFPYKYIDNKIIRLSEEELKTKFPNIYEYFLNNKEKLLSRSLEKNIQWFEFGRSQALKHCFNEKIALSSIIYDRIKYKLLDEKTFVYSGLFAIKKENVKNWDFLIETFENKKFLKFLKGYTKYMANGYYSLSSRILNNI